MVKLVIRYMIVNIAKEQLEYDFYELKLTQAQVADKYKCSISAIQRVRRKWSILLERSKPHPVKFIVSKEQLEHDFFILGLSQNQVCKKYNCREDAIRRRMREFNIVLDPSLKRTSQQQRILLLTKTELSMRQQSILVGSILGDSHIGKLLGVQTKNANISFSQCIRRKEYLEWKLQELVPFSRFLCIDKSGEGCSFETIRHPIFNVFYDLFVKSGCKVIPFNISEYLDDLALTVWWQDDGHLSSNSILCTDSFTIEECQILLEAIKTNFNIEGKIKFQYNSVTKNNYPRLNFYRKDHILLHQIVDPLCHSCFKYKCLDNQS